MTEHLADLFRSALAPLSQDLIELAPAVAPQPLFPGQAALLRETWLAARGSILCLAPTGWGKSLIGEAALLKALMERRSALWLVPTRALARERAARLARVLGPAGYRVVASSRDDREADEDLVQGRVDVAVMVYEKAQSLLLQSPSLRSGVGLVVVDEAQLADDPERGLSVELLLALWRRQSDPPQIVALSSGMAAPEDFARRHGLELHRADQRTVPLRQGELALDSGRLCWRDGAEEIVGPPRAGDTLSLPEILSRFPKPILLFVPTRLEALNTARLLADHAPEGDPRPVLVPSALDETTRGALLRDLLPRGIGLHSAELTLAQRQLVEESLRAGLLDICVATATLAEGINVNVRTVLVVPPNFPVSFTLGSLFGRAGRPGAGDGVACLLVRREADRGSRPEPRGLVAKPDSESELQAVSFALGAGFEAAESTLTAMLESLPHFEGRAATILARGREKGLWHDEAGVVVPTAAGRIHAQGGIESDSLAGWRTLLRRFPEGGGVAANLFLALGGSRSAQGIPLEQEERDLAHWPAALADELGGDSSALGRYFLSHLFDSSDRIPRRLHQAAKATMLMVEDQRGRSLAELEQAFRISAGLLEEELAECSFLAAQAHRFARMLGHDWQEAAPLWRPTPLPSPTEQPAASPDAAKPAAPAGPVLILKRGTAGTVVYHGRRLNLTRVQFGLLELLARRPGESLPYARIDGALWRGTTKPNPQQVSYHRRNLNTLLAEAAGSVAGPIEIAPGGGLVLQLEPEQVCIEDDAAPVLRASAPPPDQTNSVARIIAI